MHTLQLQKKIACNIHVIKRNNVIKYILREIFRHNIYNVKFNSFHDNAKILFLLNFTHVHYNTILINQSSEGPTRKNINE